MVLFDLLHRWEDEQLTTLQNESEQIALWTCRHCWNECWSTVQAGLHTARFGSADPPDSYRLTDRSSACPSTLSGMSVHLSHTMRDKDPWTGDQRGCTTPC